MHCFKMNRNRKGTTLVELCLVLALSAVIVTMTASFAVLVHNAAVTADDAFGSIYGLSECAHAVNVFISSDDSTGNTLLLCNKSESGYETLRISSTDRETTREFFFDGDTKRVFADGHFGSSAFESIDSLSFELVDPLDDSAKKCMLKLTVHYHRDHGGTVLKKIYIFIPEAMDVSEEDGHET